MKNKLKFLSLFIIPFMMMSFVTPIYGQDTDTIIGNEANEYNTYYNSEDEYILSVFEDFFDHSSNYVISDREGNNLNNEALQLKNCEKDQMDQTILDFYREKVCNIDINKELDNQSRDLSKVYGNERLHQIVDSVINYGTIRYYCQIVVNYTPGTGVVSNAYVNQSATGLSFYPSYNHNFLYGRHIRMPWVSYFTGSTVSVVGGIYEVGFIIDNSDIRAETKEYSNVFYIS